MNGFGQIQLTEYNNFPDMMQVSQQPQQIKTLNEELEKRLEKNGVKKTIFNEILTRVKTAFGIKNDKNMGNNPNLVCEFKLEIGECTMYERVYDDEPEYDFDFFDNIREEKEEKYRLDKKDAQKIKKVTLYLGDRSISYDLVDDKYEKCGSCNNDYGHYFVHEGSCKDYALPDYVNTAGCTLCEFKVEHPEKINHNYCPVKLEVSADNAKWFCESFLVDVLYKIISGLDFLNRNYIGHFGEHVTPHVRDRYESENNHVCTICKAAGKEKCIFDSAYPRYRLKKSIENEDKLWFKRYADEEYFKEFMEDNYKRSTFEKLANGAGGPKEAKEYFYKRAALLKEFAPIYRQCMNSLKIIVENMVKIKIVTEKAK